MSSSASSNSITHDSGPRLKVGAVVQARLGSTRFPGKVLEEVVPGLSMLGMLLKRLGSSSELDSVIVATTTSNTDERLARYLEEEKYNFTRGDECDCLARVAAASKEHDLSVVVRVTGDCPLVDPEVVDEMLKYFNENYLFLDYLSNRQFTNYPEGVDVEVFKSSILYDAENEARSQDEREHINYFFLRRSDRYRIRYFNHAGREDLSRFKLSIDTRKDLENLRAIVEFHGGKIDFKFSELVKSLHYQERSYVRE